MLAYRTSVAAGNTTTGTNPSATITPANGDLLLVFCTANGNTNAAPTCSDGNTGGTYTLIGTALKNSSADIISCFVRNAVVPNTTSTVVTVAIGAHTATEIVVVAVSGEVGAGIGTILQSAFQANGASGAPAPAPVFTNPSQAQSLLLSFVGNGINPAGVTAPTNWTRPQNVGQTACGLDVAYIAPGTPSQTITWGSNSASAFASGAIEIGITPATAGVNVSKAVRYAVFAPPPGISVTKAVRYVVLASPDVTPPAWAISSLPNGTVGVAYDSGWDMPGAAPVTYTVSVGSLPPGLSLAATTGNQAHIYGTPTTAGSYSFTILATNVGGSASQPFTITIGVAATFPTAHSFVF